MCMWVMWDACGVVGCGSVVLVRVVAWGARSRESGEDVASGDVPVRGGDPPHARGTLVVVDPCAVVIEVDESVEEVGEARCLD